MNNTLHEARSLLSRGRLAEARRLLETQMQRDVNSFPVRMALADVLIAQRHYTAGIAMLRELEATAPDPGPVRLRIGTALKNLGDCPGALEVLTAAVACAPHSPEAHHYLADAQLTFGHYAEAVEHAAEAVRLGSGGEGARQLWAAALTAADELHAAMVVLRAGDAPPLPGREYLRMLGQRLARAGAREHALGCFQRMLADDPGDAEAAHLAAALKRENPEHPHPDYVRQHFNAFAASFDQQLTVIGYAGPREIRDAVDGTRTRKPPWEILDLGCGTGLVAAELAGLSSRIDGVDIAPNMIDQARRRGLYCNLICDELLPAVERSAAASYDLVTAADVFIYVGKLEALIAATRRVLRAGGMLAFTAEAAECAVERQAAERPGFWLQYTGRYAHSAAYLRALAQQHGFTVSVLRQIDLRLESAQSMKAWLAVWSAR